jgi:hypothetical protein
LKPGGVCVDADPGLHALKKPLPGIRRSSHRKRKFIPAISTDVNKLWKAGPFIIFIVFRLREIMAVPERLAFPWRPVRGPYGIAGPSNLLPSDSAGLSPIGPTGASEKCAKGRTVVHTPCTAFPQAPFLCNSAS